LKSKENLGCYSNSKKRKD